jgi:very-short-patch-repair endonuclease
MSEIDLKTEEFIKKSQSTHKDEFGNPKYDYSKVKYINNLKNVKIVCRIHDSFDQLPKVHKRGGGCPDCAKIQSGMNRRMTIEEFIRRSEEIHQDEDGNPKYIYIKTVYEKSIEKVIITCRRHDDFLQTPNGHLDGKGCQKCSTEINAKKQTKTTQQFILEAQQKHINDDGSPKYIYDDVDYKTAMTPVKIKCKNGHIFEQTPNGHLGGSGCAQCSGCYQSNTEEFIQKAILIHKDQEGFPLFDYNEVDYKNAATKVIIKCRNGHRFEQTPNGHLNDQGCEYCAQGRWIFSTDQFIDEARKVHFDKYDYSKTVFTKMMDKVKIICKIHESEFEQTPSNHITHKQGCRDCGRLKASESRRIDVEEFIKEANIVHNVIKYDYSLVYDAYETRSIKVPIICGKCNNPFPQTPRDHLRGSGCPICKNKTQIIFYEYLKKEFGDEVFEIEKKFEDCRNIRPLPFDFYSESLNLVIEVDGGQHFREIRKFKSTLEYRQNIDFKKMKFLKDKGIYLIRIFQEDIYTNSFDWEKVIKEKIIHRTSDVCYLSKKENFYNEYIHKYQLYIENITKGLITDQIIEEFEDEILSEMENESETETESSE